jgi:hypothetical protein
VESVHVASGYNAIFPLTVVTPVEVNPARAVIPKVAALLRFRARGTGAAVTVNMAAPAGEVMAPKAAVMSDLPTTLPVARPPPAPFGESVATAAPPPGTLAAFQLEDAVTSRDNPSLNIAVAVYCWVPLTSIEAAAGVTLIDTTVAGVTFNVAGAVLVTRLIV